jgi:hypothetical protein
VPRTGFPEASPAAAIIGSQSVKSAAERKAKIDPHGYDAGKKVKGKVMGIAARLQDRRHWRIAKTPYSPIIW